MSQTVTISGAALRFVLPHICDEESRPVLSALSIEADGSITATNGKTLVKHLRAATTDLAVLLSFQKPSAVLSRRVDSITVALPETAPAPVGATLPSICTVYCYDKRGVLINTTHAYMIDGQYPNVSLLFRSAPELLSEGGKPTPAICLDPALVARFDVPEGGPVELTLDGSRGPLIVTWPKNENAIGLLMPCQLSDSQTIRADRANLASLVAGALTVGV